MTTLDSILQKLQNQPPWDVQRFEEMSSGSFVPVNWYAVDGAIAFSCSMREADLQTQIQEVTAQIQFWGRCEASCERVVQYAERQLRVWKAGRVLEMTAPPVGEDKVVGWKKPSIATMEATYRQASDYADLSQKIEIAREALTATKHVREAFQIKARMMQQYVRRSLDDGKPQLQV